MPSAYLAPSSGPLTMASFVANYLNPVISALMSPPVVITGTSYAPGTSDANIVNESTVAMALTLPPSSLFGGRPINIKTLGQAVNSVGSNVMPLASTTPSTAILSSAAGKWARLVADGNASGNWVIMASN